MDIMGLQRKDRLRPCVPKTTAVFVIGDIQGEIDLLINMHQHILARRKHCPDNPQIAIMRDSCAVIDTLVAVPLPGIKSVFLLGDHDLALLQFIKGKMNIAQQKHWLCAREGRTAMVSRRLKN